MHTCFGSSTLIVQSVWWAVPLNRYNPGKMQLLPRSKCDRSQADCGLEGRGPDGSNGPYIPGVSWGSGRLWGLRKVRMMQITQRFMVFSAHTHSTCKQHAMCSHVLHPSLFFFFCCSLLRTLSLLLVLAWYMEVLLPPQGKSWEQWNEVGKSSN